MSLSWESFHVIPRQSVAHSQLDARHFFMLPTPDGNNYAPFTMRLAKRLAAGAIALGLTGAVIGIPATLSGASVLSSTHATATVSPGPNSATASPTTQISFLGVPSASLKVTSVVGSSSGKHSGKLKAYSQGDGDSFIPSKPFTQGEKVTVKTNSTIDGGSSKEFAFTVAKNPVTAIPNLTPGSPVAETATDEWHFTSAPSLRPTKLAVKAPASGTAVGNGDVFVAPKDGPGQRGVEILDQNANVLWWYPLGAYSGANFRVQTYKDKPVLTWWQGLSSVGTGQGVDEIFNTSYKKVATVKAGNGYLADLHEFKLTSQGTALISIYNPIQWDLSSVGGKTDSTALDSIMQEVDVKTGLVEYEWHALDHVALNESYVSYYVAPSTSSGGTTSTTGSSAAPAPYDYFHINSIQQQPNGNLFVSARNTHAGYLINHVNGNIEWRLNGKKTSFKMGANTPFAWQHDMQIQPGATSKAATVTLYDDESAPTIGPQSRGEVLALNFGTKTATLTQQYVYTAPGILVNSQGNTQILSNSDVMIGWGNTNELTEFTKAGTIDLDMTYPTAFDSYRAFRDPWTGTPKTKPAVSALDGGDGSVTVAASWNGATNVAKWNVRAGSSKSSLTTVDSPVSTGFETTSVIHTADSYIQVEAVDASGKVIGTSGVVKAGAITTVPKTSPTTS
jgi:Arylsulfotransferase (ASST)